MISRACSEIKETAQSLRISGGWAALAGGIPETFRETSSPTESMRFSGNSGALVGGVPGTFREVSSPAETAKLLCWGDAQDISRSRDVLE